MSRGGRRFRRALIPAGRRCMLAPMKDTLRIEQTGAALGARVRGVDLSRVDDPTAEALRAAWHRHQVLIVPGQSLDPAALVDFSRRFGALEASPGSAEHAAGRQGGVPPEVWIISNVRRDGRPIGALGNREAAWHSDMSYVPEPARASVLYGVEVPPAGGDTWFADMYAAYAALPDDLRRAVDGLEVHHDASTTSAGELRRGAAPVVDVTAGPGARHPAVRRHPETGRPALFLGRRRNAWVVGYPLAESDALLDRLWAHCADPRFAYAHRWTVGDVVLWDNRCVIHRRDGFDAGHRRLMLRTQVRGEPVIPWRAR